MWIVYLLPVVLILAGVAYSVWIMQRNKALVAAGHGPEMFHNTYAHLFADLQPNERIVSLWIGAVYTGPANATSQAISGALNAASGAIIGVSQYTPTMHIVRTSFDRVLVAQEYSEDGERGYHRQVLSFGPGARAVDAASAHPGQDVGRPPKNEHNPLKAYHFIQLRGEAGEVYDCWVMNEGIEVDGQQRSIQQALAAPPPQPQLRAPVAQAAGG